jgi:hypothetical protein
VAQLFSLGDFDTFMKTRRLVTLCALLGALIASGVSASADEKLNPGNTGLGGTTVGGSVGSGGQFQPPAQFEHGGWWFAFCHWFRFYGR